LHAETISKKDIRASYEEIEKEQEHAEKKQGSGPAKAALWKLRYGMKDSGRNYPKARLPARFIERSRRNVARKTSAQHRKFAFHPIGKFFAIAPKIHGPNDKNKVPEKR
jgi:hypothetical protein